MLHPVVSPNPWKKKKKGVLFGLLFARPVRFLTPTTLGGSSFSDQVTHVKADFSASVVPQALSASGRPVCNSGTPESTVVPPRGRVEGEFLSPWWERQEGGDEKGSGGFIGLLTSWVPGHAE